MKNCAVVFGLFGRFGERAQNPRCQSVVALHERANAIVNARLCRGWSRKNPEEEEEDREANTHGSSDDERNSNAALIHHDRAAFSTARNDAESTL